MAKKTAKPARRKSRAPKSASRKSSSRKSSSPKKASPKKPSPKKASPKKASPKKPSPKKPSPVLPISGDWPDPFTGNPYVDWAWGPGKSYYFPPGLQDGKDKRMTLLVQLKGISAERFVNGSFFIKDRKRRAEWRAAFVIPFPGAPTLEAADAQPAFVIAFATQDISNTIATAPDLKPYVVSVVLGRPLGSQSLPIPNSLPLFAEGLSAKAAKLAGFTPTATPPAVFMGVIDDGIAFANERFRIVDSGKHRTRVQDWWKMDYPIPVGITLDKGAIDTLFDTCTDGNGVLQEDLFYRLAGLIDFRDGLHKAAAWRITHGTHVMDAACGYDPAEHRLDRPIACVQLPNEVTAQVDNGSLLPYLPLAIYFIVGSMLDYCDEQGISAIPVVINFSYGRLEGPHNGTGEVEAILELAVAICRALGFALRFVLPSGNSYLERVHAQMQFTAVGQEKKVDWHVLPDDQSGSYVEIWTPKPPATGSRLTLTVKDPFGRSTSMTEGEAFKPLGNYGWLYHWQTPTRGVFYIVLLPTTSPTTSAVPAPVLAPSGSYEIKLRHTGGLSATAFVDAWIARDDTIPGYPQFGRQSHFDDALYVRYDPYSGREVQDDNNSLVQRQCTINAIATGRSPIVIGGFQRKEMKAAEYTAAGARLPRPTPPRWPDAMAPSDDTVVLEGRLAAGSHSGARVIVAGTSVAAPQIARLVADNLAFAGLGDGATVQALATFNEGNAPAGDPPPLPFTAKPPDERSGNGRIWGTPLNKVKRYDWA